jgi:hypothetical protein
MQTPISAARTSLSIGITSNDDASIAHSAGTIPKTRVFRSDMTELRSGFQAEGGTRTFQMRVFDGRTRLPVYTSYRLLGYHW